jgi:4-oxalocrotonate tautomerase
MPLVRIDVPAATAVDDRLEIADVIYTALVDVLKAPVDDRFMVITPHDPSHLIIDPHYLGIDRSDAALIIQVTLNEGRDVDTKRAFYRAIAEGLHVRVGLRREDIFISRVEVKRENWSFGNGEAQYAP